MLKKDLKIEYLEMNSKWIESNWIELNWIESNWIKMKFELNWVVSKFELNWMNLELNRNRFEMILIWNWKGNWNRFEKEFKTIYKIRFKREIDEIYIIYIIYII